MPTRSGQKMLVPSRSKGLIEVVEIAIKGYNIHGKALKQNWFANHRVDRSTCSCKGPCLNRTAVKLTTGFDCFLSFFRLFRFAFVLDWFTVTSVVIVVIVGVFTVEFSATSTVDYYAEHVIFAEGLHGS